MSNDLILSPKQINVLAKLLGDYKNALREVSGYLNKYGNLNQKISVDPKLKEAWYDLCEAVFDITDVPGDKKEIFKWPDAVLEWHDQCAAYYKPHLTREAGLSDIDKFVYELSKPALEAIQDTIETSESWAQPELF